MTTRGRRMTAVMVIAVVLVGVLSAAQGRRGGRFGRSIDFATPESFDGGFQFCRLAFRGMRGAPGGSWNVDFPRADINLSIRLSELTRTHVSFDEQDEPKHLVVRATDDALFQCPFVMATEVGAAYFDEAEASRLRDYLMKGGFLWADDFWGSYAWEAWESQLQRVLPPSEFTVVDLPPAHPLFHAQFEVAKVPQIPSINFWGGRGGRTSEAGQDSAVPHARAIVDRHGRIMVFITHNTDIGDSWEREGDDPDYFYTFSVDGYAFGINTILYTLTH